MEREAPRGQGRPSAPAHAREHLYEVLFGEVLFGVIVLPHYGQLLPVEPQPLEHFDRCFCLGMGGVV
jgi:hypothetical protein